MASVRLGPAKAKDPHPSIVHVCSRGFELTWAVLLTHGREEENEKKSYYENKPLPYMFIA